MHNYIETPVPRQEQIGGIVAPKDAPPTANGSIRKKLHETLILVVQSYANSPLMVSRMDYHAFPLKVQGLTDSTKSD